MVKEFGKRVLAFLRLCVDDSGLDVTWCRLYSLFELPCIWHLAYTTG